MRKIFFLLFGLVFTALLSAQQADTVATDSTKKVDKDISICLYNNIWNNPAFTGFEQKQTVNLNYELFNPLMENDSLYTPMKLSMSYDVGVGKRKSIGLGFYAARSYYAATKWTDIVLSFSKELIIKKSNHLRLAITAGYFQRNQDWSKYHFGDMIDPVYGFIHYTMETKSYVLVRGAVDFNSGLFFTRKNFFFGTSLQHMTQPQMGFFSVEKLPMNLRINSGYKTRVNKAIDITPSIEINRQISFFHVSYNYYSIATMGTYKGKFLLAINYRNLSSINTTIGLILLKKLMITATGGVSTDRFIYALSPVSYFQMGVNYQIGKQKIVN